VAAVLRLYTDFVCPFCFVAEESTVPRLLAEFELELEWCGFELHPSTPAGGVPLSRLFPNVPLAAMHERTKRFAASFGVTGFEPADWLWNSRKALAVAEYARDAGRLEPFRRVVMNAHWREGKSLENDADLGAMAERAGLDVQGALAAATDAALLARVDARQADARRQGVRGIPTFVFGELAVVGCQQYETLAATAERAGVARRSATSG
jgi:predicted DsbA family dithiol-disulfide isomerase